jgi:hypothetical protein
MTRPKFTILCQLKNGCMGCCGRDFISKEKIREVVILNTKDYNLINPQVKAQFIKFRDRYHPEELKHGVCRNLIEKDGKIFCPLHPALQDGEDLRENHCQIYYFCRTAKQFFKWDKDKQDKFVKFISSKKLDNLDYSILMDNGQLLEEFENNC